MNPTTTEASTGTGTGPSPTRREFFAAAGRWIAGGSLTALVVAQGYKRRHLARGALCWEPSQCDQCLAANTCPRSSVAASPTPAQ